MNISIDTFGKRSPTSGKHKTVTFQPHPILRLLILHQLGKRHVTEPCSVLALRPRKRGLVARWGRNEAPQPLSSLGAVTLFTEPFGFREASGPYRVLAWTVIGVVSWAELKIPGLQMQVFVEMRRSEERGSNEDVDEERSQEKNGRQNFETWVVRLYHHRHHREVRGEVVFSC